MENLKKALEKISTFCKSLKLMKTALVFGSSGLVGGHLLNQLIKMIIIIK